jgi:VIT1/CCC1 family predicted Fe2+/Mn2+ transporter
MDHNISAELLSRFMAAEENEATEAVVYARLAKAVKDPENAKVLARISAEESGHYRFWAILTGREVKPNSWKIFKFFWISRLLGITFGIKLMEVGEGQAQVNYKELAEDILPEVQRIVGEEEKHERDLVGMINEERLKYVGSVVLGLSDALVELTGMLAGLTLAMQNSRLIALVGIITGIAAALSMAASQYLAVKSESTGHPMKSAVYTGVTYIITVILLVFPYLMFSNYFVSLGVTMVFAVLEILIFNYYISVAKELSFKERFWEMTLVSLAVSALSFGIGYLVRISLNVNI